MDFLSKREHFGLISNAIQTFNLLAKERRLILYASILVSIIHISEASSACTVNGIYYLCNNIASNRDFPLALPTNVRKVTLIGINKLGQIFPDAPFNHPTWANVTELAILEFANAEHIERGFLNGLEELKFLSISSCTNLDAIDPDIFHSTPNIEALYLDGNPKLKLSAVEAALMDKLSNLKYLSLSGIQASEQDVILGENFSKALHRKNLTYLDISGVNVIYVEHVIVPDLLANLKYFNLSYSTIITQWPLNHRLIQSIEILDLTGFHYIMGKYTMQEELPIKAAHFPTAIYLFAQGMIYRDTQIRANVRYSFENCDFKFPKMVDLSKNSLTVLNISFLRDCRAHALETANLRSNNMEYISPNFLSIFPSLKILDLSNNLLVNMQDMDDFSFMFSQNKDLEVVFLRNNHLTIVPSNIFVSNSKLRIIDLSENELAFFNIDLRHAADMKLIILRKNRLKNLPATFLEQCEQLFRKQITASNQRTSVTNVLLKQFKDKNLIGKRYRYGYNASEDIPFEESQSIIPQYVTINILENQFVCDCDTLVFMEWILYTDIDIVNRSALSCKYGNNEKLINNELFQIVKDNCRLASIIGIGVASSVAIIISIFTFAIMIHLRCKSARRNKDLQDLKREMRRRNARFKFLVFFPYCSQDEQIVNEKILPSLNTYLRETFDTGRNLICTGADRFVPGMRIIEEIHRCLNESLVVVPIKTKVFLQSQWSQEECVVAAERHRQVVILMQQYTDTSRAMATIQHLIGQYTRGTWSDDEGHFVIRPSWNTICEGIIRGASTSLRHYRRQNVIAPAEVLYLV